MREEEFIQMLGEYAPHYDGGWTDFRQIARHLAVLIGGYADMGKPDKAEEFTGKLRTYLRLLDEFPDFRSKQLTKREFPEGEMSVAEYINSMDRKLRGLPE